MLSGEMGFGARSRLSGARQPTAGGVEPLECILVRGLNTAVDPTVNAARLHGQLHGM